MIPGTLVCSECSKPWSEEHGNNEALNHREENLQPGNPIVDPQQRFGTPERIWRPIMEALGGRIAFDPCADPKSSVPAETGIYLPEHEPEMLELVGGQLADTWGAYGVWFMDGLTAQWPVEGLTWANPPYGRATSKAWADRITKSALFHEHLVAIVNASTGSEWWQPYWGALRGCFVRGRVRYDGGEQAGKFDSVLLYWGTEPEKFSRAASALGRVLDFRATDYLFRSAAPEEMDEEETGS